MVDRQLKDALALLKIVDAETDAEERERLRAIARKTIRRVCLSHGITDQAFSATSTEHLVDAATRAARRIATSGNVAPPSHFCLRHG